MRNRFHIRNVLAAVVLTGTAFGMSGAHAVGVTIDGNLTDLIAATATPPGASGIDAIDSGGTGYDITETYAHYDSGTDTFFVGFRVAGDIGTAGGNEGTFNVFCNSSGDGLSGNAGVFDGCEQYGVGIDIGGNNAGPQEFDLRLTGDSIKDSASGTEAEASLTNPFGASFDYIVAETLNDGIEFSITGLGYDPSVGADIYFFASAVNGNFGQDDAVLTLQAVPVPAAVWLFGSGLMGLAGFARRGTWCNRPDQ